MLFDNISCVSLDLWGTVLTPNPRYAIARNLYLSEISRESEELCKHAYSSCKCENEKKTISSGKGIPEEIVYRDLLKFLYIKNKNYYEVCSNFRKLFEIFPPIIDDTLLLLLSRVLETRDICISSNVMFISGDTVYNVLNSIDKYNVFENSMKVFSCAEYAKPGKRFFEEVVNVVGCSNAGDIIHIGNDKTCDIFGANSAGMKSHWVEDPEDLKNTLIRELI